MRKILFLLLLLLSACAPGSARGRPDEKIVVITNVNLVDVETGTLRPHLTVVIKKGKITDIAKRALIQESPLIVIVNGEGKYLIPGLWELQAHLPATDVEQARRRVFPPLLASGVTGVCDLGGERDVPVELRREIERGTMAAPRLVFAGSGASHGYGPMRVIHDAEEARAAVAALKQGGSAGLLLGADPAPGATPGLALHREMELLVEAGLTPVQALQAATVNPARFLGKEKEMGGVEVGKAADLVLLDGDPREDIHNLEKIDGVVAAGHFYSRRELDEMLAQAGAAAGDAK